MSTKTVVVIAGSALTAIGLGLGIGFTIAKANAKDDQESLLAQAEKEAGGGQCRSGVPVCDDIDDANDRGKRAATISTIGFVGMGIGLATVAAGILWPASKNESSASPVRLAGHVDRSSLGVSLGGAF